MSTATEGRTQRKTQIGFVSSRSGGVSFFARRAENAIEKHDACAAARSSTGEVRPLWSSVREAHVTGRREIAPDET